MNRIKFLRVIIIMLVISNALLLIFVFQEPKHDGPKHIIIEKLDFDAKQIIAYEKIIQVHHSNIRGKEKEILALKKTLYMMIGNERTQTEPDLKADEKDSIILLLGEKQMEIESIHLNHFREIKALCKPGQVQKFDALTQELAHLFEHKPPHKRK